MMMQDDITRIVQSRGLSGWSAVLLYSPGMVEEEERSFSCRSQPLQHITPNSFTLARLHLHSADIKDPIHTVDIQWKWISSEAWSQHDIALPPSNSQQKDYSFNITAYFLPLKWLHTFWVLNNFELGALAPSLPISLLFHNTSFSPSRPSWAQASNAVWSRLLIGWFSLTLNPASEPSESGVCEHVGVCL